MIQEDYPTFSKALLEVLDNHKQLWNDARSSAELDKFKQAGQQSPSTPPRGQKRPRSEDSGAKLSPKAKKNRQRRLRNKALLKKAKSATSDTILEARIQGELQARSGRKSSCRGVEGDYFVQVQWSPQMPFLQLLLGMPIRCSSVRGMR